MDLPAEALLKEGFSEDEVKNGEFRIFRPVGCKQCGQSGYRGRVAIAEYSNEYGPGPILPDGTPANAQDDRYRVYKITKGDGPENPDYAQWPVCYTVRTSSAAGWVVRDVGVEVALLPRKRHAGVEARP